MGWWRIDGPDGRINWSASRRNDGAILFNCIPSRNDSGLLYNGDEPADILGTAIRNIETNLRDTDYFKEAKACFLGKTANTDRVDASTISELQQAREKIIAVYVREWRRPPTPCELMATFEFCTSFCKT